MHTTTPPSKMITFRLGEADLLAAMARLQARDGISPSEMIRRALREWLHEKDVLPADPRPATRAKGRR